MYKKKMSAKSVHFKVDFYQKGTGVKLCKHFGTKHKSARALLLGRAFSLCVAL